MSRFDSVLKSVVTHCGVDPTSGDLAVDTPMPWPSSAELAPTAATAFDNPYRCSAEGWGAPSSTAPKPPEAKAEDGDETLVARRKHIRRRRMELGFEALPPPKGLLTT